MADTTEKDRQLESTGDKTEKNAFQDGAKFDWVTRRSQCSLPKVFKILRQQIDEDVKTRNALRPPNSPYEFSVTENGSDFAVLLTAKDADRSVKFSLAPHAILVHDDKGNQVLEATLTFDEQGECKLHINEEERKLWQLRRMALEELLFAGY